MYIGQIMLIFFVPSLFIWSEKKLMLYFFLDLSQVTKLKVSSTFTFIFPSAAHVPPLTVIFVHTVITDSIILDIIVYVSVYWSYMHLF